jgi:hypothetical protein
MLSLPAAWNVANRDEDSGNAENRQLASLPPFKLSRKYLLPFPAQFEAYYNDRFGFRTTLVHWLDHAEVFWLKVSPSPQVIVGKNGWYFLTEAPVTTACQPSTPLTPRQLARWQQMLEARRDWLAWRGIRYLVVMVPEKQTIYPENLPRKYRPLQTERTRLNQLMTYLHAHTTVPVLDLREPLRQAKAHERLYHFTDAHWNDHGGYIGYRRIVEALATWFPGMEPWPRSDFDEVVEHDDGGDCALMMGLKKELSEDYENLKPRRRLRTQGTAEGFPPDPAWMAQPFAMFQADPGLPRAVMFCDSFTFSMYPFLSQHFQRIAYLWQTFPTFDTSVVEREQPDIVIQELVERKLQYPDMVQQRVITPSSTDTADEPADHLCRTVWQWSTFLQGEN